MVTNDSQDSVHEEELGFDELQLERRKLLLQTSISELEEEWGFSYEEISAALGPLEDIIPQIEPAEITDLYNEVEDGLHEISLMDEDTERDYDDEGLDELRQNLLEFRRSIQKDRTYERSLLRMINKVKIKAAQVDIPGLVGISQGGPSLDELQRITDGINRNSAPQVTFRDSLVEQGDDDNILFAALKKHSGK